MKVVSNVIAPTAAELPSGNIWPYPQSFFFFFFFYGGGWAVERSRVIGHVNVSSVKGSVSGPCHQLCRLVDVLSV